MAKTFYLHLSDDNLRRSSVQSMRNRSLVPSQHAVDIAPCFLLAHFYLTALTRRHTHTGTLSQHNRLHIFTSQVPSHNISKHNTQHTQSTPRTNTQPQNTQQQQQQQQTSTTGTNSKTTQH